MLPPLALLAAAALSRAAYPRFMEWRQNRRRPVDNTGIIDGAGVIDLSRANAPGVLLLHGGGDTPQVLSGLASHLHQRGFSVRVPLLAGHGRSLAALSNASARHWLDDVRVEFEAMRSTHDWMAVVGLSMGGALAATLAAERQDIRALVLLAPYIALPNAVRRLAETSRYWGWLLPYFSSRGADSIRDRDAASRTLGHGILTPAMLRALRDIADTAAAALPRVRAPALIIQSREDNRIAPETAELAFARLGSAEKKFVWTNGAGHVITVDFGYQRVYDLTAEWLEVHRSVSSV